MLLKLIIFLFSNMYCGASEMFLNPGGGDARGEDSYWSSFPFLGWDRSGLWFLLIIFSVFWSVIRVVIFSSTYIYCVDAKRILISLFQGFQYLECIFSPQEVWLETQWMVKGSWQIKSCPKWKLFFVFSVFLTTLYVYDAKNV